MKPHILLIAFAAVALTSCTIRPTGDGGIAVVPVTDTPVSVKALVTQPEEDKPTSESTTAAPAGECPTASVTYGEWLAAREANADLLTTFEEAL